MRPLHGRGVLVGAAAGLMVAVLLSRIALMGHPGVRGLGI